MAHSPPRWLLLIHRIPSKPDYLRVKIGRRLQRIGAQNLKQAVCILPLGEETREDLQWVAEEIRQMGGEAFLWEANAVAGLSDGEIEALFRQSSEAAYEELAAEVLRVAGEVPEEGVPVGSSQTRLRSAATRSQRRLEEIRALDFFQAAGQGKVVEAMKRLVDKAQGLGVTSAEAGPLLSSYTGRTWVTRCGLYVDRIASAWLIRRYIDTEAEFRFLAAQEPKGPGKDEIRFDMFDAEFGHEGGKCTFEVLYERFGITDPGARAVGEIVHDIDLKESSFGRPETAGVETLFRGIVRLTSSDTERLEQGLQVFDQLRLALAAQES